MIFSRFVDRDMFVRYLGGGIGHQATNEYTSNLRPNDHDTQNRFEMQDGTDDVGVYAHLHDKDDWQTEEHAMDESEMHVDEREEFDSEDDDWGYNARQSDSEDEEEGEGAEDWDSEDGEGAEDSEEPWAMGDAEAEGYAEL